MARQLIELLGNVKLADLTVRDVQFALGKLAERLSTGSVRLARMILIQAMRTRDWTPRELRHTFVSLLSDSGVPIEQIAAAVGHASTRTTEVVYKHQLRPVTRTAAIALCPLFESKAKTPGGQS